MDINWITYPHKVPTLVKAIRICRELNMELAVPRPYHGFLCSSWTDLSGMVSTSLDGVKKSQVSIIGAQQSFSVKVEESYSDYLQIFTDGSRQIDNRVGAAIFIPELHHSKGWRLNGGHSVLVSELFALLQGLLWIVSCDLRRNFVIFTDSMAALLLLFHKNQKSHRRLTTKILEIIENLYRKRQRVAFQWIPSHRGIKGNEVVDKSAKDACFESSLEVLDLEFEDNLRRLHNRIRQERIAKWNVCRNSNFFITTTIGNLQEYNWLSLDNRRFDVLLARFRTGCVGVQKYLLKTKQSDTSLCPSCGLRSETIFHYVFECPAHHRVRRKMVSALSSFGINLNLINLGLLLTGGAYVDKKRLRIMQIFCQYILDTKRTL